MAVSPASVENRIRAPSPSDRGSNKTAVSCRTLPRGHQLYLSASFKRIHPSQTAFAIAARDAKVSAATNKKPTVRLGIVGGIKCRRNPGFLILQNYARKPSLWIRHSINPRNSTDYMGLRDFLQAFFMFFLAFRTSPTRIILATAI